MSSPGHPQRSPDKIAPIFTAIIQGETLSGSLLASASKSISALTTSKLANQGLPKKMKFSHDISTGESYPMDKLLAKLTEQQSAVDTLKANEEAIQYARSFDHASSSNSLPVTPATDAFPSTAPTTRPASAALDDARGESEELVRLKAQLAQAENKISKLGQELAATRVVKTGNDTSGLGINSSGYPACEGQWPSPEDAHSDTSEALSASTFNRTREIWGNHPGPFNNTLQAPVAEPAPGKWLGGRGFNPPCPEPNGAPYPIMDGYRSERLTPDAEMMRPNYGRRGTRMESRFNSPQPFVSGYGGGYNSPANQSDYMGSPIPGAPMNAPQGLGPMGVYPPYPLPAGTPLSPHASEFTSGSGWKNEVGSPSVYPHKGLDPRDVLSPNDQTYLPPTEPLNYRRLLDRNVNCNWKYIVDKIVCNNDQQASIFLQQKLKVGTPEQKFEIVDAIVAQAYPLMVNRFGNFLVQRCFEHGTPDQVIHIAEAIRGNTLNLSMDPFGCHVVQKAFDSVPENFKAIMVSELLRRIPETVIHRYACHVWQKLFELRWTESPPQIMKYVNEALNGMWHEVALGETGSLVVQNIFENCLEEDKRPCIEEVLANIDIVAHGQFGNWCIQHICEHGAPPDRSRAIDHVIRYAAEYSTDQFASKVVEKCLKIGGAEFLGRYLDRVSEGRRDRTRIPLIDIASDQYGNYLIQWILNNASPQHRENVAAHIRKHMVSLRGSKFGSRVGMLCTNHAVATRPGPGAGPGMGGRMGPGPRYNNNNDYR
ncbi:armadillo-type protein [Fusarium flagelliforme]|uniref:armadillo-type protein n=1 Tax=Fusarium flagelliforme TaxID=2675880 RepID=UPI001E8E5FD5|nr:armadillo-type protein [Fusarium flagelliforme]KAH7192308.1 armadillo-type protein [Fusarium flagelliforme]